jgi:hypothetical protein
MNLPPFILSEFSSHNFDENPIFGRKTNFGDLSNIPECSIFSYTDTPLEFISPAGNDDFEVIEVPIKDVLNLLGDEAYEIHSERWYKVRKQFSQENKTHFPWVYVDMDGEVQLMNGRHRLIAMLTCKGMETTPIQVEPPMVAQVKAYFGL